MLSEEKRIGVLKDLIEDLQLGLKITLIPSEWNKADMLT